MLRVPGVLVFLGLAPPSCESNFSLKGVFGLLFGCLSLSAASERLPTCVHHVCSEAKRHLTALKQQGAEAKADILEASIKVGQAALDLQTAKSAAAMKEAMRVCFRSGHEIPAIHWLEHTRLQAEERLQLEQVNEYVDMLQPWAPPSGMPALDIEKPCMVVSIGCPDLVFFDHHDQRTAVISACVDLQPASVERSDQCDLKVWFRDLRDWLCLSGNAVSGGQTTKVAVLQKCQPADMAAAAQTLSDLFFSNTLAKLFKLPAGSSMGRERSPCVFQIRALVMVNSS